MDNCSQKEKLPRLCTAEEVREVIKEHLNQDFTYKQLNNKRERKIYQSGFWSGTRFIDKFEKKREHDFKAVNSNDR